MEDELVPMQPGFETELRGFDRRQVLDHVESLQARLAMAEADRDAALAHVADLRKHLEGLRTEDMALQQLQREIERISGQAQRVQESPSVAAGARVQQMLLLAQEEATQVRDDAERDAGRVRDEISELRAQADHEAADMRARAQQDADETRQEADRVRRETDDRCRQLEEATEQRCHEAEQDRDRRMRAREAQTLARLLLVLPLVARQVSERINAAEGAEKRLRDTRAELVADVQRARDLVSELPADIDGEVPELDLPRQQTSAPQPSTP